MGQKCDCFSRKEDDDQKNQKPVIHEYENSEKEKVPAVRSEIAQRIRLKILETLTDALGGKHLAENLSSVIVVFLEDYGIEGLVSTESEVRIPVRFVNTSVNPVEIIWKSFKHGEFAGQEVCYSVLLPGQSYQVSTFETHPWIARYFEGDIPEFWKSQYLSQKSKFPAKVQEEMKEDIDDLFDVDLDAKELKLEITNDVVKMTSAIHQDRKDFDRAFLSFREDELPPKLLLNNQFVFLPDADDWDRHTPVHVTVTPVDVLIDKMRRKMSDDYRKEIKNRILSTTV
jgi:hypothetical protein